jgi:hypothetical protein
MKSWRRAQERREAKTRYQERGMRMVFLVIGTAVAGALALLGLWAFAAEAIPVATRAGTRWVSGPIKAGFGVFAVSMGAALHFGFVWARIAAFRSLWLPGLILSMGGVLAGGLVVIVG